MEDRKYYVRDDLGETWAIEWVEREGGFHLYVLGDDTYPEEDRGYWYQTVEDAIAFLNDEDYITPPED